MKIDFLFYQPDQVHNIKELIFGILSPERIREHSSCEIYRHITGNNKDQPGTQSDGRLGVIDRGRICQTCHHDNNDCPGHMGHINLAKPIFHPLYLTSILMKLLTFYCFRCSQIIVDEKNFPKLNQIKSKIPKARMAVVKLLVDQTKKDTKMCCPHCNATLPSKIKKHPNLLSKLIVVYETVEDGKKKSHERLINPEIVLSILKGIPDEHITWVGLHPKLSRPEWMIWTVLPFPPITVRPQTKLDIGRYSDDDLTSKLNDISKTNNNIKTHIQNMNLPDTDKIKSIEQIEYLWEILQQHISTYIDNESHDKKAVHRTGRPLKALVQRIKTKEGRVRWNLMGKRVDDSGRTVITPDNNINIDEIGIPVKIASNLVKPEYVTPFNINRLQQLVYNGLDYYPGAKYVVPKGSRYKKPLKIMDEKRRRQIKLAVGDVVFRNLLDGDWVLVNRQPSLHRMSMMAHKIVILKGDTFRLNAQSITPYNADFDGDEMNIHVPQSIEAENELIRLSHLATQIISPKNSLPVMGLVQDGLLGLYIFSHNGFLNVKNTMKMLNDLNILGNHEYSSKEGSLFTSSGDILNRTLPNITVIDAKKRQIGNDIVKYGQLGEGRIIMSEMLKSGRTGLFHIAWSDYGPNVSRELFDNLARISTNWLLISGFSIGILDCIPNKYIKDRIASIIKIYDEATQYLVDYQQLVVVPTINYLNQERENTKKYYSVIDELKQVIESEGYTYNNKSRVERLITETYYSFIVNRLVFEIQRIVRYEMTFPESHRDLIMTRNTNAILEYWADPDAGFIQTILKNDATDAVKDQYTRLKNKVADLKQRFGQNYKTHYDTVIIELQELSNDVYLLNDKDVRDELLLQQIEGICAFVTTLLYIVPGSPDMSDRLEEKLYELTQKSTNIVNNVISDNIGFYQYQGLDKDFFQYTGNSFKTMTMAKSKGEATNIGQIAGLLGQQDLEGKRQGNYFYRRSLPHYPKDSIEPKARGYVKNSFLEGLMPLEYFVHAQAGRLNQIDKTIKTAETGYLQRRLIKSMEGLKVEYDGTVRNSAKNVIQKLYGGDGIDPQQLENVAIPTNNLREFYFDADEFDRLKSALNIDLIEELNDCDNVLSKINKQFETVKSNLESLEFYYGHFDLVSITTDISKTPLTKNATSFYAFLPVNFERLVHNNYYRFELDKSDQKSDLSPLYIIERLDQMIKLIRDGIILNSDQHMMLFILALHNNLSIKRLIIDYKFTTKAFDTLLEDIYLKYCRALVPPGESIGIISAQSIGEPLTQMTLNKFHAAGVGKARSKLQGGVPRLTEMLGLTRKEKMKTPSMAMYVSDYFILLSENQYDGGKSTIDVNIVNHMKEFEFKTLVKSSEICYDPHGRRPNKVGNYYVNDNLDGHEEINTENLPWVINFQLKIDKKREMRSDVIYNAIVSLIKTSNKYKTDNYSVQVSYDGLTDDDKLESFVIIRCHENLFSSEDDDKKGKSQQNNILSYLIDLKNDIMRVNIKGIPGITDVFVEREGTKKSVLTLGSNLSAIIDNPVYSQILDINQMTSNDVMEIQRLYGIEAARNCFISEMYTTLSSDLNVRHIELLTDNMAHLGELLSVNRFGVKRGNNEPLHRASFEETTKQFVDSSIFTEHDPMIGPSANVMFGQFINSGTNAFTIVLDTEKLMQLEPVQNWDKMTVDPFNKAGVSNIIINNKTKLQVDYLVLEDMFSFKFSI